MHSIYAGLFPHSYKNYEVNFLQVHVGSTAVKYFSIKNKSDDVRSYYVTRSTATNPIYYVYDINKYEAKVAPGGEFVLKITYTPNIPESINYDYFKVVDTAQNYHRLCVIGECIGPSVHCSVKYMNFVQTPDTDRTKQIFQLTNSSRMPAIFQFDCNEDEDIFQVDPIKGTIEAHQHVYINVKFSPQIPRLYSTLLCCLILHHEPVLLHLLGIYSETPYHTQNISFRYYPFPWEETVGYKGYFSDSVTIKAVPPPISLSTSNLDFGRIMPESTCQTLTTSFTNHMENEVEVQWQNLKLFRIYPEKLTIPPQQSALYECRFSPEVESRLSSAIIEGQVDWTLKDSVCQMRNIPIPINLRLIGHSFPKNQSWIPSVTIIPTNVVLPLTLPGTPSWTTFLIKSKGHLPILYKLLPPNKTSFVMKPMMGLVREYQIVVVQLEVSSHEINSYIEKWDIELNGQVDRLLPIYIKAQTDVPFLVVAQHNYIEFEPMQPGTKSYCYVPIKNTSCCHLQFDFKTTETFGINPSNGELSPGEEIFADCWYSSNLGDEGIFQFEVSCEVQCIKGKILTGSPYEVIVAVKAECVYSELCAIPSIYRCGEVEWGTTIQTTFYLYNFGRSNVNYKLCHDHNLKDVVLHPECGRCGTREKIMIGVKFTIKQLGKNTLMIGYNNRTSQFAKDVVSDEGSKTVFRVEFECVSPTVQIIDLVEHSYGYLFTKENLWETFRVDDLNTALREVVPDEIKHVNCYVPDCEMSTKPFHVVFLIKNFSNIETKLYLQRQQMCNCKAKESEHSFTFRQRVFDCPHKAMFQMEISKYFISAKSSQLLTCKIAYLLENENVLSYMMMLTNRRAVFMRFYINSIPNNQLVLSTFGPCAINLGFVYIGLREAPVQAYWLYNNTSTPAPYKLNELEITKLCNEEGFPVLKCLNSVGFLKPFTSAPILFRFWPIQVKTYLVVVPLMLGQRTVQLQLVGNGTDQVAKSNFEDVFSITSKLLKNGFVSLSVDHIVAEPILVSSCTERLFFVKNYSKNRDVNYQWKPCVVDGLVKIEPLNAGGILKHKESHSVVVQIVSLNEPCSITLSLCCEFYDYTQLIAYNDAVLVAENKQNRLSQESGALQAIRTEKPQMVESQPKVFHISIPITVNVVGISDRDICISVEDQMKQKPFDGVHLDVETFIKNYRESNIVKERPIHPTTEKSARQIEHVDVTAINKEVTEYILQCIAGDAVFSDSFKETLNTLKTEPSPFYSQIKFDQRKKEEQREQEIVKFLTQPEIPEVEDICKDIIIDTVHTAFQLGPVFKTQVDEDDD